MPTICSDFINVRQSESINHNSNIYDINKENNLCNAKIFANFSSNIKSNVINDSKKQSVIRIYCYKVWRLLLSFLKNVIFFSLLPVAYIMFFLYLKQMENKEQNDI